MTYIFSVLQIIGALAFFIYGMKVMSDGIQRASGERLRGFLRLMTVNRYTGVLSGFLITCVLQSSSATTVMTVSFVNAGLLTLVESAGIMMGANIGTTITGWIVSLIGFKVKISLFALPIFALGFSLYMLIKNSKWKNTGEFLIGFAMLFMGLSELKNAVPDLRQNPEVLSFLTDVGQYLPVMVKNLVYLLVGALVTIAVQSSSAAMSLTIILVSQGLPLEIGCAMVLGENIGTTITAELASIVGNLSARRSAKIHTIFNIFGVVWMLCALPFIMPLLRSLSPFFGGGEEVSLAIFHSLFNLSNVLVLIWFTPWIVRLASRLVSPRESDEGDTLKLRFIDGALLDYSVDAYIIQAKKELEQFLTYSKALLEKHLPDFFEDVGSKKRDKLLKKVSKIEENTDRLEEEITLYLSKIQQRSMSAVQVLDLDNVLRISGYFEKLSDISLELAQHMMKKRKNAMSEDLKIGTVDMLKKVSVALSYVEAYFPSFVGDGGKPDKAGEFAISLSKIDAEITSRSRELTKGYVKGLDGGQWSVKDAIYYKDLIDGIERLGIQVHKIGQVCYATK